MKLMLRYPFENILNFRDLGGLPIGKEKMTRWGVFYRSANLAKATAEEADFLYSHMGIRTIIDLRTPIEIEWEPQAIAQDTRFAHHRISLVGKMTFEDNLGITMAEENTKTLSVFYKRMFENCPTEIEQLIHTLASATEKGATLFHCTAGKDRTGIAAMFLLSIAGVAEKDIVSQYEISHTLIKGYRADDITGSHYENMETAIAYLDTKYGGAEAYLRKIGVTDATLTQIQNIFIEPII